MKKVNNKIFMINNNNRDLSIKIDETKVRDGMDALITDENFSSFEEEYSIEASVEGPGGDCFEGNEDYGVNLGSYQDSEGLSIEGSLLNSDGLSLDDDSSPEGFDSSPEGSFEEESPSNPAFNKDSDQEQDSFQGFESNEAPDWDLMSKVSPECFYSGVSTSKGASSSIKGAIEDSEEDYEESERLAVDAIEDSEEEYEESERLAVDAILGSEGNSLQESFDIVKGEVFEYKYKEMLFCFVDGVLELKFDEEPSLELLASTIKDFLKAVDQFKEEGFITEPKIDFLDCLAQALGLGFVEGEGDQPPLWRGGTTDFYRWILNMIYLLFYKKVYFKLDAMKGFKEWDPYSDLKVVQLDLYSRLHPSIKGKLKTPGVSATINLYAGFDTEYTVVSATTNRLISTQLAVNTRLVIKIPTYPQEEFQIGFMHPLSSEFTGETLSPKDEEMYGEILFSINSYLTEIRQHKAPLLDNYTLKLLGSMESLVETKFDRDGFRLFIFEKTPMITDIKFPLEYTLEQLSLDVLELSGDAVKGWVEKVFGILTDQGNILVEDQKAKILGVLTKKTKRFGFKLGEDEKLSVSFNKKLYLVCHFSPADLTLLKDFPYFKQQLDIVHKSFITLEGPIRYEHIDLIIRDTSLLAPMGKKALKDIGSIYGGDFNKVKIEPKWYPKMHKLLEEDEALFREYALQDSVITLHHANCMEEFCYQYKKLGVPVTLSGIGKSFVLNEWGTYRYQMSGKFQMGKPQQLFTPKGLNELKDPGLLLGYYIAAVKGGRNESYMYGYDEESKWYDYDLSGAYTSILSGLGTPVYRRTRVMKDKELGLLHNKPDSWFLENYVVFKVAFKFPEDTKFPSIPVSLGGISMVYPLCGEGIITGPEYLLARNQGCKMALSIGVFTPWNKIEGPDGQMVYEKPYFDVINKVQSERRKHAKGSLSNLLYKEMGNSIYGNIIRGISSKQVFDVKTGSTKVMEGNELANPVLGCYITALIRGILGESMHVIGKRGELIISVTTDGFLSTIENMEPELLKEPEGSMPLLKVFRSMRKALSGDPTAYEIKHEGFKMLSWCTRGQLSGGDTKIRAMTGFQAGGFDHEELYSSFRGYLTSKDKQIEFVQNSLRGPNEIYKRGGHVTQVFKERTYKLYYDNRRHIIREEGRTLLDSKPLNNALEAKKLKDTFGITREKVYNKTLNLPGDKTYKSMLDAAVKMFLKGFYAETPFFGLDKHRDSFKTYACLVKILNDYPEGVVKVTASSVSKIKNRKIVIKPIPKNDETILFTNYLKSKLEFFKPEEFLR